MWCRSPKERQQADTSTKDARNLEGLNVLAEMDCTVREREGQDLIGMIEGEGAHVNCLISRE